MEKAEGTVEVAASQGQPVVDDLLLLGNLAGSSGERAARPVDLLLGLGVPPLGEMETG